MLVADFDLQRNNDGELINFEEAGLCNSMVRLGSVKKRTTTLLI
jgi:hypothetical protein